MLYQNRHTHFVVFVTPVLKRIECADGVEQQDGITLNDLHSHTYGIASDSLTKFAVVFSALTHDAGHPGVANAQLVKEAPETAERYEKCHAEQVSVDLAWELLMLPRYENFRKQIFGNQLSEGRRFRQVSISHVLEYICSIVPVLICGFLYTLLSAAPGKLCASHRYF